MIPLIQPRQPPQLQATDSMRCITTVGDVAVVDTKARVEVVLAEGEGAARVVTSADGVVDVVVGRVSAAALVAEEASADEEIHRSRSSKVRHVMPLLFSAHSCTIGNGGLEVGLTSSLGHYFRCFTILAVY
jgi:hypothetical protein